MAEFVKILGIVSMHGETGKSTREWTKRREAARQENSRSGYEKTKIKSKWISCKKMRISDFKE